MSILAQIGGKVDLEKVVELLEVTAGTAMERTVWQAAVVLEQADFLLCGRQSQDAAQSVTDLILSLKGTSARG